MNLLGGPKVGWRTLMMFLCFSPNFLFMLVFIQIFFKSSSWNTCSVYVEACTYHNVGKNFVKLD